MNKTFPAIVFQYLEKKSFKDWQLEWEKVSGIQSAIVVPAISEFENIKRLLNSLIKNDRASLEKSIVIFVVNNSVTADDEIRRNNKITIEFLRQIIHRKSNDQLSKEILESGLRIGLIDASSEGKEFGEKLSGVGTARKVGMDLSLTCFDYSIQNKKIIISLDADCIVDKNYLLEIISSFEAKNISAANVEFEHNLSESGIHKSGIISYEIFLRHYVAGLLFSKSAFAFHTVGSTVVCDYEAYINAGGMNKKNAAEDFYFLEKIAKQHKIDRIFTTKVQPSSRESWRVPFGTGRTMMELSDNKKEIRVYDPDIYLILKSWLELFYSDLSMNIELLLAKVKRIHPELLNFLIGRKFKQDWSKILENSKSVRQLDYQRKIWFDAFETLKLTHYLRDKAFPMMDLFSGTKKFFQIASYTPKFDLEIGINNSDNDLLLLLNEMRKLELQLHKEMNQ